MDTSEIEKENASASVRALKQIAGRIASGEFPAGSKLVEEDLSQKLGISRGPLREALLRLEERRLVERRPYSGTRVASVDKRMLSELYEIRSEMECLSIRRAIDRVSDADVEMLRRHVAEPGTLEEEAHEMRALPAGRSFHIKLVELSGSKELNRLLSDQLWLFGCMSCRLWTKSPEGIAQAQREHVQIVDAIEERDKDLAILLMRRHILTGLDRIIRAI